MFSDNYQNGLTTVYYSLGSNPLKFFDYVVNEGGDIRRVQDEDLCSLVHEILSETTGTTYVVAPDKCLKSLGIHQPILNIIVKNLELPFLMDVKVKDLMDDTFTLQFGSFFRKTRISNFTSSFPIEWKLGWNQLCFDLKYYLDHACGATFKECVEIKIYSNCRLRRIVFSNTPITADDELHKEIAECLRRPMDAKEELSIEGVRNLIHLRSKDAIKVSKVASGSKLNALNGTSSHDRGSRIEEVAEFSKLSSKIRDTFALPRSQLQLAHRQEKEKISSTPRKIKPKSLKRNTGSLKSNRMSKALSIKDKTTRETNILKTSRKGVSGKIKSPEDDPGTRSILRKTGFTSSRKITPKIEKRTEDKDRLSISKRLKSSARTTKAPRTTKRTTKKLEGIQNPKKSALASAIEKKKNVSSVSKTSDRTTKSFKLNSIKRLKRKGSTATSLAEQKGNPANAKRSILPSKHVKQTNSDSKKSSSLKRRGTVGKSTRSTARKGNDGKSVLDQKSSRKATNSTLKTKSVKKGVEGKSIKKSRGSAVVKDSIVGKRNIKSEKSANISRKGSGSQRAGTTKARRSSARKLDSKQLDELNENTEKPGSFQVENQPDQNELSAKLD
ncbi:hypothetical protein ACOME3_003137 [Neoechinorhynchus agilis]